MLRRIPITARFGFALIAAGAAWLGGWVLWSDTRNWIPVDLPVSLARGHIRTPEFRINVESSYCFEIAVAREFDAWPCIVGVRCPSALPIFWTLSEGSRVIGRGQAHENEWALGCSYLRRGGYVLDLDVREDGSKLNAGSPRLVLSALSAWVSADSHREQALWMFVILSVIGLSAIVRSAMVWQQEYQDGTIRAHALTTPGPKLPLAGVRAALVRPFAGISHRIRRAPSPGPLFLGLSRSSLLSATVFLFVAIGMYVLLGMNELTPQGLRVHLARPGVTVQRMPGLDPVLVSVRPRAIYVNSRQVSWDELDGVLAKELKFRPLNWPVYVKGDEAMEWGSVMRVVDRIRGKQVEVILWTGH